MTTNEPMTREEMLKVCEDLKYETPDCAWQKSFNYGVEDAIKRLGLREPIE